MPEYEKHTLNLQHTVPRVRREAAEELKRIKNPETLVDLTKALVLEPRVLVQEAIIDAIREICNSEPIPPLMEKLENGGPEERKNASRALAGLFLNLESMRFLSPPLKAISTTIRKSTTDGLNKIGHDKVIRVLTKAHEKASDEQERNTIEKILEQISEED